MNGQIKRSVWLALFSLSLQVIWPCALFASEMVGKSAAPDISNIGFMENPPKELKEKFPMCDVFLKVEWIDPEKNVGYSEYVVYNQGKKINRTALALVYLDDNHPVFDANLDVFRKKGKLKDIFDLIKRGEFEDQNPGFGLVLDAERNGTNYQHTFSDIRSDWDMPLLTLADHKMNVCVPYPDNQRMYFAELKTILKTVNDIHEIDRKRAEVKQWIANLSFFDHYTPIDLNFDGKEDYLAGIRIIYSHNGKYFEMKVIEPRLNEDSPKSKLISPTTGKACEFLHLWGGAHYFTTDGTNFFIDNQCSLTELTK